MLVWTTSKRTHDPSNDGVSKTLETVTVSGAVNLSMTGLSGMSKLKMIDASESSGDNTFRSQADVSPSGFRPVVGVDHGHGRLRQGLCHAQN